MSDRVNDFVKIISDNLQKNSKELSSRIEMRLGVIDSYLRNADVSNAADFSENIELLRFSKGGLEDVSKVTVPAELPQDYRDYADIYSAATDTADKVAICKMMVQTLNDNGEDMSVYKLLEPENDVTHDFDSSIRIAYRKAYGADIAFEKFASVIPDASALYRDNFAHVCDCVALGDADMCILPYENTADGKLFGFYRLIESYELKIAASCMVRSDNRDDETRYLLLSPSLSGLSEISGITDFEFSLADRDGETLTKVMSAANLFGINIRSVDTFKAEECTVFDVRTSAESRVLDAFIVYLKFEAAEFSPLGLYAATE